MHLSKLQKKGGDIIRKNITCFRIQMNAMHVLWPEVEHEKCLENWDVVMQQVGETNCEPEEKMEVKEIGPPGLTWLFVARHYRIVQDYSVHGEPHTMD